MSLDKFIGTLLGCAVGDALGMCVESWKPEQIRKYAGKVTEPQNPVLVFDADGSLVREDEFGKLKYWNHKEGAKKGDYTDDTILTLALAEAIIESRGLDLDTVGKKMVEAVTTKQEGMGFRGGFGRTTLAACDSLARGVPPQESGIPNAKGNGPVMKTAPLGLYVNVGEYSSDRLEEAIGFAINVAKMTHGHPSAVAAAGVQTYAIAMLSDPSYHLREKEDFAAKLRIKSWKLENGLSGKDPSSDRESLTSKLAWIEDHIHGNRFLASDEEAYRALGNSGITTESYPFALFMFLRYLEDPAEGLIETVNWGGDCDTTGAIYGALAGAANGDGWLSRWSVKDSDRIRSIAKKLYEIKGSE